MTVMEGSGLGRAVRYNATEQRVGGHCYFVDCRKASGTSHCSHILVPKAVFSVSGEPRFFDKPADSVNVVHRGFCPTCGSPVYSVNFGHADRSSPEFDTPDAFSPRMNLYSSRAPAWGATDQSLPTFAEPPPPRDVQTALKTE